MNWCLTPFFNLFWLYVAVSFHSWRNKLFLGVNQQPFVTTWHLPLMRFEPQRRGASSFKERRLNNSATEDPCALRHCSTLLCYTCIWRSVSTAGGTDCTCILEGTSNLPLAAGIYLAWDSNPNHNGECVSSFKTTPATTLSAV